MAVDRHATDGVSTMLEVIDKGHCSEAHPIPLLFVHGGRHAAWCWDEHFLSFFSDNGYRAIAVSLRGPGRSQTSKPLRTCSISDYVEDVGSVADSLSMRPVVIGHSMGGLVVQKYLESHEAPAGVLVASVPVRGVIGNSLRFMRRHPWLTTRAALTGKTLRNVNSPTLAREGLFSAQTPESLVVRYAVRFQEESTRAIFLDMMLLNLPKPNNVTAPLLVLGGECDGVVTPREVCATARAYSTEAEFLPGVGHDMMLEAGWATIAERIHNCLSARGL
jgi:pimeloyl-ACP methyl ester carboxylesterase